MTETHSITWMKNDKKQWPENSSIFTWRRFSRYYWLTWPESHGKKIKSLFFVTSFADPNLTSSNLPEKAYILPLEKRRDDSYIHAVLAALAVIRDIACLNWGWVEHCGQCCSLRVIFNLFTDCTHPFLGIKVYAALLQFKATIKFRNTSSFWCPDIPENLMLNNAPTKSCIYCMWEVSMQCNQQQTI